MILLIVGEESNAMKVIPVKLAFLLLRHAHLKNQARERIRTSPSEYASHSSEIKSLNALPGGLRHWRTGCTTSRL